MIHKNITIERLMDAVERRETALDNPGFCRACGEENSGCEPDAKNYECEYCDECKVCSPEILLGVI